jgi:hypothetical protein
VSGVSVVALESEGSREVGERDSDPIVHRHVGRDCVMPAAQVLHERVSDGDRARGGQASESAHRPQPCLEPTVVGADGIVGAPLGEVRGPAAPLASSLNDGFRRLMVRVRLTTLTLGLVRISRFVSGSWRETVANGDPDGYRAE